MTKCPACRGDMCWIRIGSVDLLECTGCDGTWIESRVFDELCAQRDQQALVVKHRETNKAAGTMPAPAERVRYRPCPQCGKMMNRQNFGRLSGTIIDTCRSHGTFLDRGELHQIVQFILDGGFDRMRQAELQRLKDEQQRLKELELHLSRGRGDGLGP
jgi:Zn-finger nucleic acid-binding protein